MFLLGAITLQSRRRQGPLLLFGLVGVASGALAPLYRALGSDIAPPAYEQIGAAGWLAVVLMVSVPLIAVVGMALRTRARTTTVAGRIGLTAAAGVVALALYPLYGMIIYCTFTGVCP